jgi:hypothetical protein
MIPRKIYVDVLDFTLYTSRIYIRKVTGFEINCWSFTICSDCVSWKDELQEWTCFRLDVEMNGVWPILDTSSYTFEWFEEDALEPQL